MVFWLYILWSGGEGLAWYIYNKNVYGYYIFVRYFSNFLTSCKAHTHRSNNFEKITFLLLNRSVLNFVGFFSLVGWAFRIACKSVSLRHCNNLKSLKGNKFPKAISFSQPGRYCIATSSYCSCLARVHLLDLSSPHTPHNQRNISKIYSCVRTNKTGIVTHQYWSQGIFTRATHVFWIWIAWTRVCYTQTFLRCYIKWEKYRKRREDERYCGGKNQLFFYQNLNLQKKPLTSEIDWFKRVDVRHIYNILMTDGTLEWYVCEAKRSFWIIAFDCYVWVEGEIIEVVH